MLVEFHLLWIESDYDFYSGFYNEIMHKYFVYSFCFILQFVLFYSSSVFTSKENASYAELYFCM